MPSVNLSVQTDHNGRFHRSERLNPPGPDVFPMRVELHATLLSPRDTRVEALLDIDAVDGRPSNQRKDFTASSGERVALGTWTLDGGDNIVILTGRTIPARTEERMEFIVDVAL